MMMNAKKILRFALVLLIILAVTVMINLLWGSMALALGVPSTIRFIISAAVGLTVGWFISGAMFPWALGKNKPLRK